MIEPADRLPEEVSRERALGCLETEEPLRASMVRMKRKCGSKGCHCERGTKHVSWYLSVRQDGKRKMIYIPEKLEQKVRKHIRAYHDVEKYIDFSTDKVVRDLLAQKRK